MRTLRELARGYLTIVEDLSRVMNRLKALYRSWAISCAGRDVYYTRHRDEWLGKIKQVGVRRRAEQLYQQARRELLLESRKHVITVKLRQIPSLGPIRCALAVALIQTPHRFRTKRQLWACSGLALESGEHCFVNGQLRRSKKQISIRGLNKDHNHDLKLCRHQGQCPARTASGFLPAIAGERHQARHGPSHAGAQDCSHCATLRKKGSRSEDSSCMCWF